MAVEFVPVVVIGLVTIGVGLSIFLLARTRKMTIKGEANEPSTPQDGDTRVIRRGDGTFFIEEFGWIGTTGHRGWVFVDAVRPDEYEPEQEQDVVNRVAKVAAVRAENNRIEKQKTADYNRIMNEKKVISYSRSSKE